MIARATLLLLVVVSCAHALVHTFELSLPAVEKELATTYAVGKEVTGMMGTLWRLPLGCLALATGWIVDRTGPKSMLAVYLFGCAAMCLLASLPIPLPAMFVVMFSMGTFASIYHPAGLTLISQVTHPDNRPLALGIHGVFGSLGIGSASLVAGVALAAGLTWRQYYLVLAVLGAAIGAALLVLFTRTSTAGTASTSDAEVHAEEDHTDWMSFSILMGMAALLGMTYSAFVQFLPRYIGESNIAIPGVSAAGFDQFLASGVLYLGCIAQFAAGVWARPRLLERQIAWVLAATVPILIWLALADSWSRLWAAALFALIHFMHQPLYNSLIAKYSPRRRRSLCYGIGFTTGLGIGSLGSTLAGLSPTDTTTYGTLAAIAAAGTILSLILCRRNPVSK